MTNTATTPQQFEPKRPNAIQPSIQTLKLEPYALLRYRYHIVIISLSLSFLSGCGNLRGGKLFAPETFGFIRVTSRLYIEKGIDEPTKIQLLESVEKAENTIRNAYGSVESRPSINACISVYQ